MEQAQTLRDPQEGDHVIANREGKTFTKGTQGVVKKVEIIDSDRYLFIMTDGLDIGPTADSYWDVDPETAQSSQG